jgi:hypothetical protein
MHLNDEDSNVMIIMFLGSRIMKMSKELFGELCDTIDSNVISKYSLGVIQAHRRDVKYTKNQFVSFCWAIFHASKFDCMRLYNAGLNDSHIETALKHILSDFA